MKNAIHITCIILVFFYGMSGCFPAEKKKETSVNSIKTEQAIFGAGCFWGVEAAFSKAKGVINTEVGYSGGTLENPSYEDVKTGKTGHAEVVRVEFDPTRTSYEDLLNLFWQIHDPTLLNQQGPDIGTQYRSVIFYQSTEQKETAIRSKVAQEKSGKYNSPVVTEISPALPFYRAEEYHQKYLRKHGDDACAK